MENVTEYHIVGRHFEGKSDDRQIEQTSLKPKIYSQMVD